MPEDEDFHNPFDDENPPPPQIPSKKWDPFAPKKRRDEADFVENDDDISTRDT
jgi:hypothetical protein